MATLKQRVHRKNSSGYDTIHYETEASIVTYSKSATSYSSPTNVQQALDDLYSKTSSGSISYNTSVVDTGNISVTGPITNNNLNYTLPITTSAFYQDKYAIQFDVYLSATFNSWTFTNSNGGTNAGVTLGASSSIFIGCNGPKYTTTNTTQSRFAYTSFLRDDTGNTAKDTSTTVGDMDWNAMFYSPYTAYGMQIGSTTPWSASIPTIKITGAYISAISVTYRAIIVKHTLSI